MEPQGGRHKQLLHSQMAGWEAALECQSGPENINIKNQLFTVEMEPSQRLVKVLGTFIVILCSSINYPHAPDWFSSEKGNSCLPQMVLLLPGQELNKLLSKRR